MAAPGHHDSYEYLVSALAAIPPHELNEDTDETAQDVADLIKDALPPAVSSGLARLPLDTVQDIALSGRLNSTGTNVLVTATAHKMDPADWREILFKSTVMPSRFPLETPISSAYKVLNVLLDSEVFTAAATTDIENGRPRTRTMDLPGHVRNTLDNLGHVLQRSIQDIEAAARENASLKDMLLEKDEMINRLLDDFRVKEADTLEERIEAALHRPPGYDEGSREFILGKRSFDETKR